MWNNGIRNAKQIHTQTSIPLSTVYDNIKKLKNIGTTQHAKGAGRPKKITAHASRALGQYVRRDTSLSTRTLATKLSQINVQVSHATVARHMATLGYSKSLPKATPMLTAKHKERRVEWAKAHLNDDWNRTLFSDETAFQLFRNTVERWHKGAQQARPMPKDRTKIMAWGGFSVKGKTSLFCFRQIMNAEFYVNIISRHIPEINSMLGNDWRFQQDNDPKHTSRIAKAYLQENVPEMLEWPSNSPDLNPIENLWAIVKRNVEKRMPRNIEDLEQFMKEEWQNIPDSIVINLVNSMSRRCQSVTERNGERINY